MDKYKERLIKAFKEANCIRSKDIESKLFQDDFNYWLKSLEVSKQVYLELIKRLNINVDSINTIEIGTGKYDSLGLDLKTTIVSPYFDEEPHRKGLTLIGKPIFVDDTMKYERDGAILDIPVSGGRLYLTQNATDMTDLAKLVKLSRGSTVVVGAYGRSNDYDMHEKIRELKKYARKLEDYIYDCESVSGTYCYAIISKKLTKSRD